MSQGQLSEDLLKQIGAYTAGMQKNVSLILNKGDHEERDNLKKFLGAVASCSDRLSVEERDMSNILRSPVSFSLEAEGDVTGISFSGIPSGHEFNSLILAILQCGGVPSKLDDSNIQIIKSVNEKLRFEVFVSLNCHNCPDIVQMINQFALLNENIEAEMIDGGLFQEIIAERNITGVPCVYVNGEPFSQGRTSSATLIQKLGGFRKRVTEVKPKEFLLQDLVVIGAGPAGVSAAIYGARKGFKTTIVAETLGGQLKDTLGIENFISIPSTTGAELSNCLTEHLQHYDITLRTDLTVSTVKTGDKKSVRLNSGEIIESTAVIIATGAQWRKLGVPGEEENMGNGVAYCPHCEGPFYKGKDVAVVGGGNSGIEAAVDLANIVKSVTVLEYLPELKADQVLIDRARSKGNIHLKTNAETTQILSSDGHVTGLAYRDRDTEEIIEIDVLGVFVQIGLLPNTDFLNGVVELNRHGEIIIDDAGATSEPGIFACGDVTTVPYKQIVVSVGEGAKAAISASEYLQTQMA